MSLCRVLKKGPLLRAGERSLRVLPHPAPDQETGNDGNHRHGPHHHRAGGQIQQSRQGDARNERQPAHQIARYQPRGALQPPGGQRRQDQAGENQVNPDDLHGSGYCKRKSNVEARPADFLPTGKPDSQQHAGQECQGDQPRLWIDVVAHVVMGRDKREYRFVQDTRYGRKVLSESSDITVTVTAITNYVANRLVERSRALTEDSAAQAVELRHDTRAALRRRNWRMVRAFLFGLIMGCVALFAALWIVASQVPK